MAATTRYARIGDAHVAYQVFGDGPRDLVLLAEWCSHVEEAWEQPLLARSLERLGSLARVVMFDKRGTGLSDPVPLDALPGLDAWLGDIGAVLDTAGVSRPVVLAVGSGGPVSMLFAAAHPDLVSALVLVNSFARLAAAPDHPIGRPGRHLDAAVPFTAGHWGSGAILDVAAPSVARDPTFRAWYGRWERMAASPGAAVAMQRMFVGLDVRSVLPSVRVPTFVLHRVGDRLIPSSHGEQLARSIPGARLCLVPGDDHLFYVGDVASLLDEVEEFLTGVRGVAAPRRVLTTVLYTDLVDSTRQAVALGDEQWHGLLDRHDAEVRRQLVRYDGREIKTVGDGFVATFDAPARAIEGACAIRAAVRSLGLEVRLGLHTGEVEVRGEDLGGLAMHIGARVAAEAGAGEVLVSRTVADLVAGSGIRFDDRGDRELRGVPGRWQLLAVASR